MQDSVIHARRMLQKRKKSRAADESIEQHPKVEQHFKCMDDAILHGKPFGNCVFFYIITSVKHAI